MIAYYAHSQGYGHSNAAEQFCKIFSSDAIVLTSAQYDFDDSITVVPLPSEDTIYKEYSITTYNLPEYAHYLPKKHENILDRNIEILKACKRYQIELGLIDVSVETAIQFRIAGIPYAYHKMLGERNDTAHQLAYQASEFLFTRYPAQLDRNSKLEFMEKTYHLGFLSRFKFRKNVSSFIIKPISHLKILCIAGKGGTKLNEQLMAKLIQQVPDPTYTALGLNMTSENLNGINHLRFTKDIEQIILEHDVIISSCGLNLSSEILALKNKFIAVPERRPYNEQEAFCKKLVGCKLAIELNADNFLETLHQYQNLRFVDNLSEYFGSMENFKRINYFKNLLS